VLFLCFFFFFFFCFVLFFRLVYMFYTKKKPVSFLVFLAFVLDRYLFFSCFCVSMRDSELYRNARDVRLVVAFVPSSGVVSVG